jgi:hypothetical protein
MEACLVLLKREIEHHTSILKQKTAKSRAGRMARLR